MFLDSGRSRWSSWMGALRTAIALSVMFGVAAQAAPSASLVEARRHSTDASINAVTFRTMDAFYPTAKVNAGNRAASLRRSPVELHPDVTLSGKTMNFDAALTHTQTNALLVMRDGKILYERYLNGSNENSRFIAFSVSKSITSILIGIALEQGKIKSLQDKVEAYVPELKGTGYEGVTIEQMLMMREGTDYKEQPPDGSPSHLSVVRERSMHKNEKHFTDIAGLGLKRINEPGSTFNYSTLTTSLLGRVLEAATRTPLPKFTEENLWKPAGMEASGHWLLDGDAPQGLAVAGGGFNATLRDLGRVGQLMLDGGRANGKQIVSSDWVKVSTQYKGTVPVIPGAPRGYQYQWWTMMGTQRFEAIGIHGQFIQVDPPTRTVIVKMSYWPEMGGAKYNIETLALLDAIRNAVSLPNK